jgi:hypothetical protein
VRGAGTNEILLQVRKHRRLQEGERQALLLHDPAMLPPPPSRGDAARWLRTCAAR